MTGICRTSSEERADFSQMLPEIERYSFTAKEWDEETGLYYMSARYQNPEASRWVSADPAGWELINPNRNAFSMIESMNPYSYAGNNPIRYSDPTGRTQEDEVTPTYFTQDQWQGVDFEKDFNKTACAATSLLNEVAEQYTSETGDALTLDQGKAMMQAAMSKEFTSGKETKKAIDSDDAFINSWTEAANAMWGAAGQEGKWSMNGTSGGILHRIFFVDTKGKGHGTHFINSGKNNIGTFDVYNGRKTTRSANYRVTDRIADILERASGQENGSTMRFDPTRPTRDLYFRKEK